MQENICILAGKPFCMRNHKIAIWQIALLIIISSGFYSCEPKDVYSDPAYLYDVSKEWMPYWGYDELKFINTDSNIYTFHGTGAVNYFERVLYQTDQSGFFTTAKNYYADLERIKLTFISDSTDFDLICHLEKNLGEAGEYDMLTVRITNGFTDLEIKKAVYYSSKDRFGEKYLYTDTLTINNHKYADIQYNTQERRPYKIYYNKTEGIVGFKITQDNVYWNLLKK